MSYRCFLLIISAVLFIQAGDHHALVEKINEEYLRKQREYNKLVHSKRYRFEILTVEQFPTWCSDEFPESRESEPVYADEFGTVVLETENGAFVGVRSWIDRGEKKDARVTRLFLYRYVYRHWRREDVIKIIERWDEEHGWVCK
jgi:hypothetical protein